MSDAPRTVGEALGQWLLYRTKLTELSLVAGSTLANQSAIVTQLAAALGTHALSGLRKSHIELWMGGRLRTCAPITVRGEMNVLRQVLRWCVDEGFLAAPPRLPKLSVPTSEPALPADDAVLWVLANVPPQHARALEFMMVTGLSPHELERLQVRDARADASEIGIGQRADFAVKQPSRRRWVPLSHRAQTLWFEASAGRNSTMTVFPTGAAMQKAIRRAVDAVDPLDDMRAGLAGITPKLMRKWFASKVAMHQPEHVLQRLMGHAPGSPITRRHYVRSSDAQVTAAVEGLAP